MNLRRKTKQKITEAYQNLTKKTTEYKLYKKKGKE